MGQISFILFISFFRKSWKSWKIWKSKVATVLEWKKTEVVLVQKY